MLWEVEQSEVEFMISLVHNFYWIGIVRLHDDQDVHDDHDGVPRKVEPMECRVEAEDHKEQKVHDMPDEVDEAPDCGPLFHMLQNVNRKFKMFAISIKVLGHLVHTGPQQQQQFVEPPQQTFDITVKKHMLSPNGEPLAAIKRRMKR